MAALTLIEAKKRMLNEGLILEPYIVEQIYTQNPIYAYLPFKNITGLGERVLREANVGMGQTRPLYGDYTEQSGAVMPFDFTTGRVGDKAKVDAYIVESGGNLVDQMATEVALASKRVSAKFQALFFNGDRAIDPDGFDGLKKMTTANGMNDEDASPLALEDMDSLSTALDSAPTAIFANAKTLGRVTGLARSTGFLAYQSIDEVGSQVAFYNGVPLIGIRPRGGNEILEDGELYVVTLGEDGVYGIQTNTPTPNEYAPSANDRSYTTVIDWFTGIAQRSAYSAQRVKRTL